MEDLPRRLAELLETVATRVRAMTIDRIARFVTMASLAAPLLVLAVLTLVFLLMTVHGALAVPLTNAGAFGVLAGLFAVGGAFAWRKRSQRPED
jgi:succinate-acetate transporter protein